MNTEIDLEILQSFVQEAGEILEEWESCVFHLEKEFHEGDFNKIARLAHNL